jgi:lipopolysaccharide export system protein LptA
MPLDVRRLRMWIAGTAIVLVIIVAGFYFAGRIRALRSARELPGMLGVDIQQSTEGFTLSKAQGGRTVFTVHASNAIQYKEGGRAELHDVSIVVYGRESNRYDQIYGSNFEYDPQSGDIHAKGVVHIDLEGNAQGPLRPDQAVPPELKNPIHLKTTDLVFNQKSGVARTTQRLEFNFPQASGSAVGAVYDAQARTLTLDSEVQLRTVDGTTVDARHAVIAQNPQQAVLTTVKLERPTADMNAERVTLFLRQDNSVSRILAQGDVQGITHGPSPVKVRAPQAEFFMRQQDQLDHAVLSGGVNFEQGGESPANGSAQTATLRFGPKNAITSATAAGGFKVVQMPRPAAGQQAQTVQLDAGGAKFKFVAGHAQTGETTGAAQITIRPQATSAAQGDTRVTAARFETRFDPHSGRMQSLHGEPQAKIVSVVPGQPDRVSTSRALDVRFDAVTGAIANIRQAGNVRYVDGQRTASAEQADYDPATTELVLSGHPRFTDTGITTTAQTLSMNQKTGDAAAEGNVKTTYNDLKPQPGGAMLASSDPVHVTSSTMRAQRASSVARYSGAVRLWQGANVVEAPAITFDRNRRSMTAQGTDNHPVSTVFVQMDKSGNATPVRVSSEELAYSDSQRTAKFTGGVVARSGDSSMKSQETTVFLQAAGQQSGAVTQDSASRIERIVAEGRVVLQEPLRRATGERLVYTASDGKYVMTGGSPSIFDAEHGAVTGNSLTFYSHDDRVLVGSAGAARSVTQTRIAK